MLHVALKFLQMLQLMKWKLNECRKNVYEDDFHNTVSKSDWFYSVTIRALEILKSESVQPMTMTSSMNPFPKKKKICIYHLSRKLMTIGSPITLFK